MFRNGKGKLILKIFVIYLSFAMATAGFSAVANSGRIIPTGKVSIIKDGNVVGQFSKEAQLPEGYLLKCEAKCAVRFDDLFMVAEPDTTFSVTPTAERHELYAEDGTIYYSISETSRPLQFSSPAGDATTGELALTDSALNGYVHANGSTTEIGVIDGGTMMLGTAAGDMAVTPDNAVTIEASDPEAAGGLTKKQKVALGAAAAAIVAAGTAAVLASGGGGGGGGGGGDKDSSSGSPASP